MKRSLWRQPYLIELTYAESFRLVKESIDGRHLKILEVGCGTGFMSLELARMGHYVTAIDRNKDLVSLAERTAGTDPYAKTRGGLTYYIADFNNWNGRPRTFDVVLFSRVLHDMRRPDKILSKAHGLLKAGGIIVCLEYAYNLMNRKTAIWLYQTRRFLDVVGWTRRPQPMDKIEAGVNQIITKNSKRRQHINTFQEMQQSLGYLFHEKHLSWHPYYCWEILAEAQIPDLSEEKRFATLLRGMEQFLMKSGEIEPALFRFVGTKR